MAHEQSLFFQALDRSQAKKDGGYKQNWSFANPSESEGETENDEANLLSMDDSSEIDSPEEKCQQPSLKSFCNSETLKTYERRATKHLRPLKGNALGLNMLGPGKKLGENPQAVTSPAVNSRTKFILVTPPPTGIAGQGRRFQQANAQAVIKTPAQSLDLKERKEYLPHVQKLELDSIILTCPESTENSNQVSEGEIKRRIQQKRRPSSEVMECFSPTSVSKKVEELDPDVYLTLCGNCSKPSEDHVNCENCGQSLLQNATSCIDNTIKVTEMAGHLSRPPIHALSAGPKHLPQGIPSRSFYSANMTLNSPMMDVVMTPPARTIRGNLVHPNGRAELAGGTSTSSKMSRSRKHPISKPLEPNDPIVLSSDEDEETENASTGSVSRMDSESPRPADSAHSSPAPSGGRVEAAVKDNTKRAEQTTSDIFTDIDIRIPRKARMKDQFGNNVPDNIMSKRRKVVQIHPGGLHTKLESIILDCRSIRIGSLRRMVTKPVIFTLEYIKIDTEAPTEDDVQQVMLRTSELIHCEWCSAKKLPVIFFQTTPEACLSLQTHLKMSREDGGVWYDCKGDSPDEQYIVLIFENGLSAQEHVILEEILQTVGTANKISDFLVKLKFEEANRRLVRFNKSYVENSLKDKQTPDSSMQPRTIATRLQTSAHQFFEDDEEMADMHTVFTGPVQKLIVYPPAPAKGGISVTNEDLHCLNEGEFLNDVIIDFYLKYLVLEKLKKEDAQRSHVFSSFFYKRLNQRERRNVQDTANLTIQQRKHKRVKTWTRHVDLFQKDFIFVPINESAHWFLAVICYPGLSSPQHEPNPLYKCPPITMNSSTAEGSSVSSPEEPDNTAGRLHSTQVFDPANTPTKAPALAAIDTSADSGSNRATVKEGNCRGNMSEEDKTVTDKPEMAENSTKGVNGALVEQANTCLHYKDGLQRIRVSYSPAINREDDTFAFSDDQDSSQEEGSDDGTFADDPMNSAESRHWHLRPTICKQPCILIMDSLRGPTRSNVVKTLREYLEVEWEARKGSKRSFPKELMRGSSPRVPQQDNFSDCGVYILQYVESFFENSIPSFDLPMNLTDWFPQHRMKKKREEIKELILKLQEQQQTDRIGQTDPGTEALSELVPENTSASCSD
ncbi:sentrin-specific protease 6-like isoform X4 [Polyodon spathula]|uniref:sentrin-specific protease 6-like isoform X4 n=1 Tax=Polyodon spathula TaxID=7913 RepID=UPI001B7D9657|nr:sentrin-specific protease 6-like isoform X4 [Polyodon spathula]